MHGSFRLGLLTAALSLTACGGAGSPVAPLKTSGEIFRGFHGDRIVVHPDDYTSRVANWTVDACGEDCVSITQTQPSQWTAQARLVEREWSLTVEDTDSWICGDASRSPLSGAATWRWNAANLLGTVTSEACEDGDATVGIGLRKRT